MAQTEHVLFQLSFTVLVRCRSSYIIHFRARLPTFSSSGLPTSFRYHLPAHRLNRDVYESKVGWYTVMIVGASLAATAPTSTVLLNG